MKKTTGRNKKVRRFTEDVFLIGSLFAIVSYHAIPYETRYESDFGFFLLWLVTLILGVWTTPQSKHTIKSIVGILIVPFSLDFLMAYQEEYIPLIWVLCLLCTAVYTIAVICICYRNMRSGRYHKRWLRFFHNFLFRCRTIICTILVAALLFSGGGSLIESYLTPEEPVPSISFYQIEPVLETISNRTDVIAKLENEKWDALPSSARLNTLQEILDIECAYLGLPDSLTVSVIEMDRESVHGSYSHSKRTVNINKNIFNSASPVYLLSVLLHEVYHSFQHACIDLYETTDPSYQDLLLFDRAVVYAYESSNYISGAEDYQAYYNQLMEADSRAYEELRIQDYQDVLTYLNQQKS